MSDHEDDGSEMSMTDSANVEKVVRAALAGVDGLIDSGKFKPQHRLTFAIALLTEILADAEGDVTELLDATVGALRDAVATARGEPALSRAQH